MTMSEKETKSILSNEIPQTSKELRDIRYLVDVFLSNKKLTPPLLEEEVLMLSTEFIQLYDQFKDYQKLLAVMINNYVWRPVVSGIPFDRRILLLPQCMRYADKCPAKVDDLGLMCEFCGLCDIQSISEQAEALGYHVIVSEGTTTVKTLLSSGSVECVIGVGCMESFERSFPLTVKEAVPSLAIPLFSSDCKNSVVDLQWLKEVLPIKTDYLWNGWLSIESTRKKVQSYFSSEEIEALFGNSNRSKQIANEWMNTAGKRWRPLIMVAVQQALSNGGSVNDDLIKKLAVSVECFHKASLAHDDIADNDPERYGKPTLHEEYDMPVALNTGDLLMGYGYQMIAESGANELQIAKLLKIASHGHRDLCLGQGEELIWRNSSEVLSVEKIIKIFSDKTSPAFEVALKFGAVIGGADENIMNVLGAYSRTLGIAYQIKDDLDDFTDESSSDNFNAFRPSLPTALLGEQDAAKTQEFMDRIQSGEKKAASEFYQWAKDKDAISEARYMLDEYKLETLEVLNGLSDVNLKVLLYRLANRILG